MSALESTVRLLEVLTDKQIAIRKDFEEYKDYVSKFIVVTNESLAILTTAIKLLDSQITSKGR